MSHLIQLREQIKAIQTTKKITHAVRLVSMSLYAKLEKKNINLKDYCNKLSNSFSLLLEQNKSWKNPIFHPQDLLDSNPLIIVIATTKGLCGSLNANLFRYLEQSLFIGEHQSPKFIIVGQRALKFFKQKNYGSIVHSYSDLNSNNYVSIADDLIGKIINPENPYTSVTFYNNILKSFFIQQSTHQALIPLNFKKNEPLSTNNIPQDQNFDEIIWEQQPDIILKKIATNYARTFIINRLFEALLAEHAARFLAMDASTNNAEKFLERLTLQYNKTRQYLITREVAELTTMDSTI